MIRALHDPLQRLGEVVQLVELLDFLILHSSVYNCLVRSGSLEQLQAPINDLAVLLLTDILVVGRSTFLL